MILQHDSGTRRTVLLDAQRRRQPLRRDRPHAAGADDCRAGCTWTGFVLFGKPGNNPYCHHRALELSRRGLRERVVRLKSAPNLPFDHGEFALQLEPIPAASAPDQETP